MAKQGATLVTHSVKVIMRAMQLHRSVAWDIVNDFSGSTYERDVYRGGKWWHVHYAPVSGTLTTTEIEG